MVPSPSNPAVLSPIHPHTQSQQPSERKRVNKRGMEVVRGSGNGGRLNPWAEPFVPGSWYRAVEVEDFSPEWWRLVASSPAFRDRWLRDYCALGLLDADLDDGDGFLPDDFFSSPPPPRRQEEEEREEEAAGKKGGGEVAPWGIEKWWRAHCAPQEGPRYAEKAPRRVAGGARVSPRTIQQPR